MSIKSGTETGSVPNGRSEITCRRILHEPESAILSESVIKEPERDSRAVRL